MGGLVELARSACEELVRRLGDRVAAVALFGSVARGEHSERSDFDFLVVVRDFRDRDRRFKIYDALYSVLRRDITLIDVDEDSIFREDLVVTPLLLNIAWDGIVLYDPSGRLTRLFERIRRAVQGRLQRYRTRDGKYGWKPVKGDLGPIEV